MFTRKVAICAALFCVTAFAFASIGGGGNNSANKKLRSGYTPVRTSQGFYLRSPLNYSGSLIHKADKLNTTVNFNSLVTYRNNNGNVTYIVPNNYRLSTSCSAQTRSNLQLLNLRIKLSR